MKKSVKWLLILLAAAGVGYYFSENRDEEPEFATQKLSRGNITEKVTASGIINPISTSKCRHAGFRHHKRDLRRL